MFVRGKGSSVAGTDTTVTEREIYFPSNSFSRASACLAVCVSG